MFGADPGIDIEKLRGEGFDYVILAVGAEGIRPFPIEGDNKNILPSFKFLQD